MTLHGVGWHASVHARFEHVHVRFEHVHVRFELAILPYTWYWGNMSSILHLNSKANASEYLGYLVGMIHRL